MAGEYTQKYGDALRRLQALDMVAQGQPVSPQGPQPMTGAFQTRAVESRLDPRFAPNPSMPAMQQAGQQMPAGGALSQPSTKMDDPAQGGIAGAGDQKAPQSVSQIVSGLDKDERAQLKSQLEQQTGKSLDELHAAFVEQGLIAPPAERKPRAKEKLSTVAEAMFRYLQLAGGGKMDPGAAAAQATLETQGRRGALEQADIDEANAAALSRRGEVQGVLSGQQSRAATLADREAAAALDAEKAAALADKEFRLERMRQSGADRRTRQERRGAGSVLTLDDGTLAISNPDDPTQLQTMTREVEEEVPIGQGAFKPGEGPTKKVKVRRPAKTKVKEAQPALDPDNILKLTASTREAITGDPLKMAQINAEAARTGKSVKELVDSLVKATVDEAIANAQSIAGGGGAGTIDFSELPD